MIYDKAAHWGRRRFKVIGRGNFATGPVTQVVYPIAGEGMTSRINTSVRYNDEKNGG